MFADSTDGPFDQLGHGDHAHSQQEHHGSISNTYDVLADELGRSVFVIIYGVRCIAIV